MLCVGWAVHHAREKQCAWRNPAGAPGLGCLVAAFNGESVLIVWSGVQASLTRLGGGAAPSKVLLSFSTLETLRSSRVGMKPTPPNLPNAGVSGVPG